MNTERSAELCAAVALSWNIGTASQALVKIPCGAPSGESAIGKDNLGLLHIIKINPGIKLRADKHTKHKVFG